MTLPNAAPSPVQNEISAGIIVYRKTAQGIKILLLYHGGGYWNFPKGHIEAEEKSLQTAIRETSEETGLRRSDLRIDNQFRFNDKYEFYKGRIKIVKTVIFYLAETRMRHIRVSHEHDGFGWFSYKEAVKLLAKYKDSIELLKMANQAVERQMRPKPPIAPASNKQS